MGDLWSARIFFLETWWAGYFLPFPILFRIFFLLCHFFFSLTAVQDFFYSICATCNFFSKRLQECFFFLKNKQPPPPPPPLVSRLNGRPLVGSGTDLRPWGGCLLIKSSFVGCSGRKSTVLMA